MTEPQAPVRPRIQLIDVSSLVKSKPDSDQRVAEIRQRLQRMFPQRRAAPYIDDSADPLAGLFRPEPSDDDTLACLLESAALADTEK
jgi:hypothetical protein